MGNCVSTCVKVSFAAPKNLSTGVVICGLLFGVDILVHRASSSCSYRFAFPKRCVLVLIACCESIGAQN